MFVGHAPIAKVVSVSATVLENATQQVRMFFVPTDSPRVRHEYSGIKGFPNGWLELHDVRVPGALMLVEDDGLHQVRATTATARMVSRAGCT